MFFLNSIVALLYNVMYMYIKKLSLDSSDRTQLTIYLSLGGHMERVVVVCTQPVPSTLTFFCWGGYLVVSINASISLSPIFSL